MAWVSERLDHVDEEAQHRANTGRSAVIPTRLVSIRWLYGMSGLIVATAMALLIWAVYSLPPRGSDLAATQQATIQEATPLPAAAPATFRLSEQSPRLPDTSGPPQPLIAAAASVPAVEGDPSPQVTLHIQSPTQRETAQRLATTLQQRGYNIPRAAILEAKGPARTEVRYFHPTEAEEATAIAMLLHQPYRLPPVSSLVRGRKDATSTRYYEVWLGPDPQRRGRAR